MTSIFGQLEQSLRGAKQNDRMVIGDNDFYPLTPCFPSDRNWTTASRIIGNVLICIPLSSRPTL
jgi:hypothetical protein